MLYSVGREQLLMEVIDYSMLFRWFVGMNLDEPVWDGTVVYEEPPPPSGRRTAVAQNLKRNGISAIDKRPTRHS